MMGRGLSFLLGDGVLASEAIGIIIWASVMVPTALGKLPAGRPAGLTEGLGEEVPFCPLVVVSLLGCEEGRE